MGMAGWVRLGAGTVRALPVSSSFEIDFSTSDFSSGSADELAGIKGEDPFELYPDLAEAIARDAGLKD